MLKYTLIAPILALLLTSTSDAGLILNFSQPLATISVGQSINVDLILTQSGAISGTDITLNGLAAVDVELLLDTSSASVLTITPGPGFEDSLFGSDPTTPLMSIQSINAANGVLAPVGSPTSILLSSFTFTGVSVGTTVVTTVNKPFTDFVFATNPVPNADIDGLIFGAESFTVNVTAVPEPSSIIFFGAAVCLIVAFKRRSFRFRFSPL